MRSEGSSGFQFLMNLNFFICNFAELQLLNKDSSQLLIWCWIVPITKAKSIVNIFPL